MHIGEKQAVSGAEKQRDALLVDPAEGERQAAGEEGLPSSSDGVWCDLSRVISVRENPDAYRK